MQNLNIIVIGSVALAIETSSTQTKTNKLLDNKVKIIFIVAYVSI